MSLPDPQTEHAKRITAGIVDNGCLGKEQHETEAAAVAAHRFRVRNHTARSGDGAHPYRCDVCQKWHIGH